MSLASAGGLVMAWAGIWWLRSVAHPITGLEPIPSWSAGVCLALWGILLMGSRRLQSVPEASAQTSTRRQHCVTAAVCLVVVLASDLGLTLKDGIVTAVGMMEQLSARFGGDVMFPYANSRYAVWQPLAAFCDWSVWVSVVAMLSGWRGELRLLAIGGYAIACGVGLAAPRVEKLLLEGGNDVASGFRFALCGDVGWCFVTGCVGTLVLAASWRGSALRRTVGESWAEAPALSDR